MYYFRYAYGLDSHEKDREMAKISSEFDEAVPQWDVALEAMVRDEYQHLGRALDNQDFRRLANQYAIRFDDIMATLFELAIRRHWDYQDSAGNYQVISRKTIDKLYVHGRLDEKDLRSFTGGWRPSSR